jgi:thiol-disulfide isomerase/thioredoxin
MPSPRPTVVAAAFLLASLAQGVSRAQVAAPSRPAEEKSTLRIVGDDAPPLAVGRWLKGEPVENLDRGRVYVIDFWATRFGSHRATIPHLTQLAAKYPAVTFIGVALDAAVPDEVVAAVDALGDKAGYRMAVDALARPNPNEDGGLAGSMYVDWLDGPSGRPTPPLTYLVDADGTIAWIGSPMRLEEPLKQVLAGTYDRAKARAAAITEAAVEDRREAADLEYANAANGGNVPPQLRLRRQATAVNAIADAELADLALQERIYAKYPETRGAMLWAKFRRLMKAKQYDEAYKVADERAAADDADEAQVMNELAWCIVDDPSVEQRDLPRARRYAEKAAASSDHVNAAILDTLAKACFLQGEIDRAIELQSRAIELANVSEDDLLRGTLETYKAAKKK